ENYLGFRYGAGMSTIYFLPHQEEKLVIAPVNAGIVYRNFVQKYVGTQVELNYGQRGYSFMRMVDSSELEITRKSHVIELPAMMQVRIFVTENFKVLVNGICYAACYLKNEESYEQGGVNITKEFTYDNMGGFELGVGGGLGLSYSFGRTDVILDGRYIAGLSFPVKPKPECYESVAQQGIVSLSIVRRFGK
ncbi:MAG: PorT family protein, partial [Prevotellaceae bacterium]|nr:PorT family protein [Prevotellaceae bacterium]